MKEAKLFQFIALISIVTLAPMLTGTKILPAIPANVKVDEILGGIGPGPLPDWHEDAQVQLGWIFDDPTNPQESTPLPEWDKAIGDIPVWSYIPNRTAFGYPAQWYIRIPNLINNNPSKKFWISWVYEFDTYLPEGLRSATNIDWYPNSTHGNSQYLEEWFDSDGVLTTDYLQATHARVTYSLDLHTNPYYEDVWLGVYGGSKNAVEVYIKTLCVEEIIPEGIGPGPLPDWHEDAQVQLGWIFDDPTNPQESTPLPGWDKAIGNIPVWSYIPNRTAFGYPAQWYIRIPNLINDNPSKKFWISWVYEFDTYLPEGLRSATNLEWYPDSGHGQPQYLEEWFNSDGELTTDFLQATHARVTQSLDLYPNPQYEDVWLGVYGGSKNAVEVYIKTLCVEEIEPATIGPGTLPDWHEDAQVQLGWIFDDSSNPQDSSPLPGWDKTIGDIPVWSYNPNQTIHDELGQWYIRIPNLDNDNPAKKFWISWVYEFDPYFEGVQAATNLDWYPNSGSDNPQILEEWFDGEGVLTTNQSEAAYGRITGGLDLYPNPLYEDIWLGLYNSLNAREVYIKTLCVEEVEPVTIGPGTLPDWHEDAQVQLGWIFDDPTNPQDSSPLPGWDKTIGDIPVWSYNPNQTILDQPGQWYIRIPNLDNDNPAKKVWISWIYEFDPYFEGVQAATNLDWYPNSGSDNPQILEEWFDGEGVLTTNQSEAAYGRITGGLDLYPNPLYEDIWLGLYNSLNAREVYIKTLCVTEPEPEIDVDVEVTLTLKLSPDTFEFTTDIELGSNSEIEVSTNIKLTSNGIEVTADISLGTNNLEIAMNFGLNSSFGEELGVIINIKLKTSEDGMEIITDFEMNTPSSVIQTVIDMNIGPDSFEFSSDVDLSSSFDNIEVSTNFSLNPGGISASTDIDLDSIEAVLDILLISDTNPS